MTDRAIDYPIELAELAYAHSLIPNKAQKEKAVFDARVKEVRERLTPLAATETQQDVLAANMVVFQQVYIVRVSNVLRNYIQTAHHLPKTGRAMHEWQRLDCSLSAWLRTFPDGMEKNIREAVVPDALIAAQRDEHLGGAIGRAA